jgi:hypothetical protein
MKTSLVSIFSLFAAALFSSQLAFGSPAVLIEETPISQGNSNVISSTPAAETQTTKTAVSAEPEKWIVPLSQRASIDDVESQTFDDAFGLRAKRRVGVGMSVMGQLGLAGGTLELNFTPENSMTLGFGGGPGYTAFGLGWKYLLGGRSFTPYLSAGYAGWHGTGSGADMSNATPSVLSSKFLSYSEMRTGQFDVGFLTPTVGLQYTQLSGESLGWGGFLELSMMTKFSNGLAMAPLASLGGLYYF